MTYIIGMVSQKGGVGKSTLARMMARNEVRIVGENPGGIIERAWQAVMSGLRSFAGQPTTPGAAK